MLDVFIRKPSKAFHKLRFVRRKVKLYPGTGEYKSNKRGTQRGHLEVGKKVSSHGYCEQTDEHSTINTNRGKQKSPMWDSTKVHSGYEVNMWEDRWIPTTPARLARRNVPVVHLRLIVSGLIKGELKEWDVEMLKNFVFKMICH